MEGLTLYTGGRYGGNAGWYSRAGGESDGYFGAAAGAGGFDGGGGNGGFSASGAAADDGPGWWSQENAFGADYFRRQKDHARHYASDDRPGSNYRPGNRDGEPIEATYAELAYIDSDARAYDTGWCGHVQQARDTVRSEISSLKESLSGMDGAFAIGFGAQFTVSGLTHALAPALSGEAYLPAQVSQEAATSFLPLLGAVAGTVIGAKVGGPTGDLAGQFVGQAAGAGLEDVIDQYSAGHTFAQQKAGMSLGEGRGGPEAVDEFVNALRSAATPAVKELAESITALGKSGVVSPGAASTFGALQFALGPAYVENVSGTARYLESSPALAQERVQFGQGTFTADQLYAQSQFAYAHGDFAAGQTLAATATARDTPPDQVGGLFSGGWQQALREGITGTPREQKGGLTLGEIVQEDWTSFVGGTRPGLPTPTAQAKARQQAQAGQSLYEDYEANQSSQALGSARTAQAAGVLQLALVEGAEAAQLGALLPSCHAEPRHGAPHL